MPRGGKRVGAGRKPGSTRRAIILDMDGRRVPSADTADASAARTAGSASGSHPLMTPPRDLPAAQQHLWLAWAPYAIAEQTLVPSTVAGFCELLEQFVLKRATWKRLQKFRVGSDDYHAQMRHYVRLAQRVDSTLARFKLTSFGKPAEVSVPVRKPGANPWAKVAGQ